MASFVEQATLKVNDQSTAQINRINSALKQLRATANSLKSVKINLGVNDSQVKRAVQSIRALKREVNGLRSSRVRLQIDTGNMRSASAQLRTYARDLRNLQAHGRIAGGTIPAVPPAAPRAAPRGRRGAAATGAAAAGAGARGFLRGTGITGVSEMLGAFGAVSAAGYAAAKALRAVASAAAERDRAALQANVQASEAQRKIFDKMGKGPPEGAALPMTEAERSRLRTSLLGDVQGSETERAVAAVNIAKTLETQLLPRDFAAQPEKSREETLKGLRQIVQAVNLASTDIVDKNGQFSADGLRALKGIQTARAADPELEANTIKTTLANLKTAGLSLNEEALARVLINAGSRGVRAANETFRAMRGTSGNLDNKTVNDALADMGFLTDFKRKGPKENKAIVPGSGKLKDAALLEVDPAVWFQQNFVPKMIDAIEKSPEAVARKAAAKKEGKSPEEVAAAGAATNAEKIAFINKKFAGMSAAGLQGIVDMVTGFDQMNASLAQAKLALEQPVADAISKAWTAQIENVGTAMKDSFGKVGDQIMQAINAAGIANSIAQGIRDNPGISTGIAAALGVGVTTALGAAAVGAFSAPAAALTASAASLEAAAVALGGQGVLGAGGKAAGAAGNAAKGAGVGAAIRTVAANPAVWAAGAALGAVYLGRQLIASTTDDPSGYTNQMLQVAKQSLEMQKRAAATETDPERKALAQEAVKQLTEKVSMLQQAVDKMDEAPDKKAQETSFAELVAALKQKQPFGDVGEPPKTSTAAEVTEAASRMEEVNSSFSTSFLSATGELKSTAATFPEVFSTGAATIGQSGNQVVSTIQGAAPGIGQVIGSTAAAAIKAAVSNLNINVNANVTGAKNSTADKGGSNPD